MISQIIIRNTGKSDVVVGTEISEKNVIINSLTEIVGPATPIGNLTMEVAFNVDNSFGMYILSYDTPFTANIDWGDGNTDVAELGISDFEFLTHQYGDYTNKIVSIIIPDKTYSCGFGFEGGNVGGGYINQLNNLSDFVNLKEIVIKSSSIVGTLTIPNTVETMTLWNSPYVETVDLGNNPAVSTLNFADNPSLNTISFTNLPNLQYLCNVYNCALSQIIVDSILVAIDNNGYEYGSVEIYGGTTSPPSAIGLAVTSSLIAKGWYVETN